MDLKKVQELTLAASEQGPKETARLQEFVSGLMGYAETNKPYVVDFNGQTAGAEIDEFTRLLAIQEFDGQKVSYLVYENTDRDSTYRREDKSPDIKVRLGVFRIWNGLADRYGPCVEWPNNYRVGFLLEYDEETVIAFSSSSLEIPHICSECQNDEDAIANYEEGYSCDHARYGYEYENWAIVLDKKDADKIDWENGEVDY